MIRHERRADRVREHDAADVIREAWQLGVLVLPELSRADYHLVDVAVIAVGEFKNRNVPFGHYPDEMLEKTKWYSLRGEAARLNARPLVFVRHTDGLYWAPATDDALARFAPGGRWDRNDPDDNQQSAYVKNDAFAPIERCPEWHS